MAFPIAPTSSQPGEQTVGLVYNQETAQWERVYRQASTGHLADPTEALSQEMPVDPPDEDSLRRYALFCSPSQAASARDDTIVPNLSSAATSEQLWAQPRPI